MNLKKTLIRDEYLVVLPAILLCLAGLANVSKSSRVIPLNLVEYLLVLIALTSLVAWIIIPRFIFAAYKSGNTAKLVKAVLLSAIGLIPTLAIIISIRVY